MRDLPLEVIVLSDVRIHRESLALTISNHSEEIEVVAACADADETVEALRWYPRAIVLVDAGITEQLLELRRIGIRAPGTTLLALTLATESEDEILEAAEAGISGYLSAEASIAELFSAIEHAARGELLCSPRIAGTLVRRVATLASTRTPVGISLTAREKEVLKLLSIGLSNKQIALRLSIRLATVKNHVHSVLAKLNVKRRGEAVAATRREGVAVAAPDRATYPRWSGVM